MIKQIEVILLVEVDTEDQIHLFKDDNGNWKTNNYKAIDWLCTKIENSQTSLVIDVYEEEEE